MDGADGPQSHAVETSWLQMCQQRQGQSKTSVTQTIKPKKKEKEEKKKDKWWDFRRKHSFAIVMEDPNKLGQ